MEQETEFINHAIWVAHSLFERGKVAGSSANLSFMYQDKIYITASGSCFGTLTKEDFSVVQMDGTVLEGRKPSKELPLHAIMYRNKDIKAVIHTHSFYATLWSCLDIGKIPRYTPYLKMKVGTIGIVPYAPPGSQELFDLFDKQVKDTDGFILANHGPVIGGKDIMDAFYGIEELEESIKTAWFLRNEKNARRIDS